MPNLYLTATILLVSCFTQTSLGAELVDSKDRPFLAFGKTFKVESPKEKSFSDPHEVARYAVWSCSQGKTQTLLTEMQHVEKNPGLGKAFVGFLKEFGPDLERYKGQSLSIKFHGYYLNEPTSVWYYYLVHEDGKPLEHNPWISVHRSRQSGRCALTGIFLYDSDLGPPSKMPSNLVTSLPK